MLQLFSTRTFFNCVETKPVIFKAKPDLLLTFNQMVWGLSLSPVTPQTERRSFSISVVCRNSCDANIHPSSWVETKLSAQILKRDNEFKEAFKSSIFLLIKYTILEQVSRKISQINFSFIQHLYVGDELYVTDYEQVSSVFCGFGVSRGGGRS